MRYRKRMTRALLSLAFAAALSIAVGAQTPARAKSGLTAVEGIKVGHHTLSERPTGCTAILVDGDAVGGVSQRGGAPGTRETDLLDPLNMVDKVNAVVLAGGSAFGLEAATGTVRWLEEHNIGWSAGPSKVPIVPAAILFDLGVGGNPKIRPTADCGYKAAEAATTGAVPNLISSIATPSSSGRAVRVAAVGRNPKAIVDPAATLATARPPPTTLSGTTIHGRAPAAKATAVTAQPRIAAAATAGSQPRVPGSTESSRFKRAKARAQAATAAIQPRRRPTFVPSFDSRPGPSSGWRLVGPSWHRGAGRSVSASPEWRRRREGR